LVCETQILRRSKFVVDIQEEGNAEALFRVCAEMAYAGDCSSHSFTSYSYLHAFLELRTSTDYGEL
jgi:hypothetical protein